MAKLEHHLSTGPDGFPMLHTTVKGLHPATAKRLHALITSSDPRKRKRGTFMLQREIARG